MARALACSINGSPSPVGEFAIMLMSKRLGSRIVLVAVAVVEEGIVEGGRIESGERKL